MSVFKGSEGVTSVAVGDEAKIVPVISQVHGTLFDLAEDFKAPLQLGPRAVGPQSPHVHHPSLLYCFFPLPLPLLSPLKLPLLVVLAVLLPLQTLVLVFLIAVVPWPATEGGSGL